MWRAMQRSALGLLAAAPLLAAAGASSADDSCREWRREHCDWKVEAMRRYLKGAPQREIDAAVFELLQREAYLTSCDVSVGVARADLVGWRLVGRMPDEFGSAVMESVLARSGFDLELRHMFADPADSLATASNRPGFGPQSRGRTAP